MSLSFVCRFFFLCGQVVLRLDFCLALHALILADDLRPCSSVLFFCWCSCSYASKWSFSLTHALFLLLCSSSIPLSADMRWIRPLYDGSFQCHLHASVIVSNKLLVYGGITTKGQLLPSCPFVGGGQLVCVSKRHEARWCALDTGLHGCHFMCVLILQILAARN